MHLIIRHGSAHFYKTSSTQNWHNGNHLGSAVLKYPVKSVAAIRNTHRKRNKDSGGGGVIFLKSTILNQFQPIAIAKIGPTAFKI